MFSRRTIKAAGFAIFSLVAAAPVALGDDLAKKLEAIEAKTWDYWKAKDQKNYAALLAEPAVRVTAEGVSAGVDKTVTLDTSSSCNERHYKLGAMRSHKITDDVYVLTYRASFGETCGGKPATYETYFSSMYRKDGDAWKNVVYTETAVTE